MFALTTNGLFDAAALVWVFVIVIVYCVIVALVGRDGGDPPDDPFGWA